MLCYTDSKTAIPSFNEVFTFKNGHFESESFGAADSYEKAQGTFSLTQNKLILNDSIELSIRSINTDSLIVFDETTSYTFKKLNDSLKNLESHKIKLEGKTYRVDFDGNQVLDITYRGGKILLESESIEESQTYYKRIHHNGFNLLFQQYAIPKIFKSFDNDTLTFIGLHKKMYEIKMWEK